MTLPIDTYAQSTTKLKKPGGSSWAIEDNSDEIVLALLKKKGIVSNDAVKSLVIAGFGSNVSHIDD